MSTVKNADQIAVVSAGQVCELGLHKELMDKRGEYFKMVTLQNLEGQHEGNDEVVSAIGDTENTEEQLLKESAHREKSQHNSLQNGKSTTSTQTKVSNKLQPHNSQVIVF